MSLKSSTEHYASECERRNLPPLEVSDLEMELIASMWGVKTRIPRMAVDQKGEHVLWLRSLKAQWGRATKERRQVQRLCIEALRRGYDAIEVREGEKRHGFPDDPLFHQIVDQVMSGKCPQITFQHRYKGQRLVFSLALHRGDKQVITLCTAHNDAVEICRSAQERA